MRKAFSRHSILLLTAADGALTALCFFIKGLSPEAVILSLCFPALLALSVIDFKTHGIPAGFPVYLGIAGLCNVALHFADRRSYLAGFFAVSGCLWFIQLLSGGKAIGGGDVKLMAVCGLILGWKGIVLAFFLGAVLSLVIHLIRMKVSGEGRVLALGPYLSAGVIIAGLWGDRLIRVCQELSG